MPACIAGLGSETFTMTSLPVMIESSTVSPSQPELCGPIFVFNPFLFCELLSLFPFSFDRTVAGPARFSVC